MLKWRKVMADMAQESEAIKITDTSGILMPTEPLTERQFECLVLIYQYFIAQRFYPSQKELAAALNIKSNVAVTFTGPLKKKGYLISVPGRQRNMRLTETAIRLLTEKGVIKGPSQMTLPEGGLQEKEVDKLL